MPANRPTRSVALDWSEVRSAIAVTPRGDGQVLVCQLSTFADGDTLLLAGSFDSTEMEGKRPEEVMQESASTLRPITQGKSVRENQRIASEIAGHFLAGNSIATFTLE